MKVMLKKTIAMLGATVLLLALIPGCSATGSSLEHGNLVGNLAYDFSLTDLNGNTLTLSSLLGRPVMINFWSTT